jgi:hypothetical protein
MSSGQVLLAGSSFESSKKYKKNKRGVVIRFSSGAQSLHGRVIPIEQPGVIVHGLAFLPAIRHQGLLGIRMVNPSSSFHLQHSFPAMRDEIGAEIAAKFSPLCGEVLNRSRGNGCRPTFRV